MALKLNWPKMKLARKWNWLEIGHKGTLHEIWISEKKLKKFTKQKKFDRNVRGTCNNTKFDNIPRDCFSHVCYFSFLDSTKIYPSGFSDVKFQRIFCRDFFWNLRKIFSPKFSKIWSFRNFRISLGVSLDLLDLL